MLCNLDKGVARALPLLLWVHTNYVTLFITIIKLTGAAFTFVKLWQRKDLDATANLPLSHSCCHGNNIVYPYYKN